MLIEQIRVQRIKAMKQKDADTKSILTTLLGELETKAKTEGSDITDAMVMQACKKFISTNEDTLKLDMAEAPRKKLLAENKILVKFLPTQLTEAEIVSIIKSLEVNHIGEVMKHFASNYTGRVNNGLVSKLAKKLLQ